MLSGKGYILEKSGYLAYRPPGYPVFLAGVYSLFGTDGYSAARAAQALLGAVLVAMLMRSAHLVWGSRRAVLITGAFGALYPYLIYYTPLLLTETLFSLLAVATLWSMLESRRSTSRGWVVAAGAALGLACLTRPTLLPFILTGALWYAFVLQSRRRALLFAAVALITLTPWTVRNYVRLGAIVPVATNGPVTLLKGAVGDQREGDASWSQVASVIASRPDRFAVKSLDRSLRFWSPWPLRERFVVQLGSALFFVPLVILAIAGARTLVRRDRETAALLGTLVVTFFLVHALSVAHIRFRVPVVDPVLILLAAGAIARGSSGIIRPRKLHE